MHHLLESVVLLDYYYQVHRKMLIILALFLLPLSVLAGIDCSIITTEDEYIKLYKIIGYVSCPNKPKCDNNFDHNIVDARFTENEHGRCQINTVQFAYMQIHCECTSKWHATEPINSLIQVTMKQPPPPPPYTTNGIEPAPPPETFDVWISDNIWFPIVSPLVLLCLICVCWKIGICRGLRDCGCDLNYCTDCCNNICSSWSCCSIGAHARAGYQPV